MMATIWQLSVKSHKTGYENLQELPEFVKYI